MTLVGFLQLVSAFCALIAAAFWFWSVKVVFPARYNVHVVRPDMSPMSNPMGGTYIGHAYSSDFDHLTKAQHTQSRRNAIGAVAAGISALLQAASLFIGIA